MTLRFALGLTLVLSFSANVFSNNAKLSDHKKKIAANVLAASQLGTQTVANVINKHTAYGLCCKFSNGTGTSNTVYVAPNGGTGDLYNINGETEIAFTTNQACTNPAAQYAALCFVARGELVTQIFAAGNPGYTDCYFYND